MIGKKNASVRRWTKAAEICYFRGCQCKGCFYDWFFANTRAIYPDLDSNYKCKMKNTVLELIRVLGRSESSKNQGELAHCYNCIYLDKRNTNTYFCRIKAAFINPKRQHKCKMKHTFAGVDYGR